MDTIWQPTLEDGQGPKYKLVALSIKQGIALGALSVGSKLPPVRELAWQLGITPGTVARAYTILTDEGVLQAEVGRGTFVAGAARTPAEEAPIEIDVITHLSTDGSDQFNVSFFSPHIPAVGQDKLIRRLLAKIAENPPSGIMHYPSRDGAQPARQAVVRWLQGTPLGAFTEADVVLSNGGQNGVLMVLQASLKGRRPTVLIEELAYPGFRRAAELLRADVVPVAMDDYGIIPEALEDAARTHDAQILCTSPEVHNPTGSFTPIERREEIVRVARLHDLQILEDDCYRMGVNRAPTYRMIAPERGWYVSSIAKTLTPSLRVGFAIAPEGQGHRLRSAAEHSFFGLATPITDLCAELLNHPQIDDFTQETRNAFSTYVQSAVNILGGYDVTWRDDVPFLWLKLPTGWRAGSFVQAAETQGVRLRSAEDFACRDARAPHAVRLAINAGVSLTSFEAAVERLRHLLDNPPDEISV